MFNNKSNLVYSLNSNTRQLSSFTLEKARLYINEKEVHVYFGIAIEELIKDMKDVTGKLNRIYNIELN